MGLTNETDILERLLYNEPLRGLSLPKKDRRIDLRGLQLPEPKVIKRWQTPVADVAELSSTPTFYGANIQDVDFSDSSLPSVRFRECEFSNCCFDRCQLPDLLVSATIFRDCSFRGANLRGVGLGIAGQKG